MGKPIKRHPSLVPVSREHHFGLLLSWKIREGLKNDIAPERIMRYCRWFYDTNLKHHFSIEEKYLYPILGYHHPLIVHALEDHHQIEQLMKQTDNLTKTLTDFGEILENHIRFEERNLFNIIQESATEEQLKLIVEHHNEPFNDTWEDEFWNRPK